MIGVIVTFQYEDDFDRPLIEQVAAEAAPRFEGLPDLRSTAFTVDVANRRAINFYVWQSEQGARLCFNDQMVERVTELYGVRPTIDFVEVASAGGQRSVTSLFDPLDPIGSMGRMWTRGQRDAQSWFDQWVDATAAWTSAATSAAPTPERLLGELIDGVLARFGGQRMTMTLHGHAVSGVLDGLRVSGPAGDHRAHVVLTDVDWEGRHLEEVVVRAASGASRPRPHLDAHGRACRDRGTCSTRGGADVGRHRGARLDRRHRRRGRAPGRPSRRPSLPAHRRGNGS